MRWAHFWLITFALPLLLAARSVAGCSRAPPAPAGAGQPQLKVLTYNVNFGIPGDRPTMDAIADSDADVVLLQETNEEWEQALRSRFVGRYPYQLFVTRPAAGGMGVMSRSSFALRETIPSPVDWFPALRLLVDTPLGPVQVLSVHLHPPVSQSGSWISGYFTTGGVRLKEMNAFVASLEALPTLVVGDFNEEADGQAVDSLLQRGARDAVSGYLDDTPTWHWPVGPITLRMQLDHVLYQGGLRPTEVRVREAGNSDHFPVLVTFVRAD